MEVSIWVTERAVAPLTQLGTLGGDVFWKVVRKIPIGVEVVGGFQGVALRWLLVSVEDGPGVFCPEVEAVKMLPRDRRGPGQDTGESI